MYTLDASFIVGPRIRLSSPLNLNQRHPHVRLIVSSQDKTDAPSTSSCSLYSLSWEPTTSPKWECLLWEINTHILVKWAFRQAAPIALLDLKI